MPDKVRFLRRLNLSRECPRPRWRRSRTSSRCARARLDVRFSQTAGPRAYLLKHGGVRLYHLTLEGQEVTTAAVSPSQLFGLGGFLGWRCPTAVGFGEACSPDRDSVVVTRRCIQAPTFIICTEPVRQRLPVPAWRRCPTSPSRRSSTSRTSRSLLVLGGGPVGVELAQDFARVRSEVTLAEKENHLLHVDHEAADILTRRLAAEGVLSDPRTGPFTVV